MAARTNSKVTPKYKTKYRVKNWPAYEAALRKRGDVTLWFDEDALVSCPTSRNAWSRSPLTGRGRTRPRGGGSVASPSSVLCRRYALVVQRLTWTRFFFRGVMHLATTDHYS